MNAPNPYLPPAVATRVQATSKWPPVFCIAMFVASMLLCCLRVPLLALDLSGDSMGYDPAFEPTVIPGIATSSSIVFWGLVGNALLLGRISWGIPFGVCLILSVAASIGVDIWIYFISASLPGHRSTILSESVSIAIPLFRSTLLLFYTAALAKFSSWSIKRKRLTLAT